MPRSHSTLVSNARWIAVRATPEWREAIGAARARRAIRWVLAVGLLALAPSAYAQLHPSTACGVGIAADESTGYVGLPQGDVFCPLVADPKTVRSFASYLRARATQFNPTTQSTFDTDVGAVGGGESLINRNPDSLAAKVWHAGVELRPMTALLSIGSVATLRPIAAVDVKATEGNLDRPSTSAMAGIDISRRNDPGGSGRRWMILAQFYSGPSPYGQFYRDDIRYYGVGVAFNP